MGIQVFDEEQCCVCGVSFGVPSGFKTNRRNDKRTFYCPNGHGQSYKESEADKLRRERDSLVQRQAMLEDQQREALARAVKAEKAAARLKKRASAGTCPCCNRTFSNMAEHMKHQHPEFVSDGGAKIVPIKRAAHVK